MNPSGSQHPYDQGPTGNLNADPQSFVPTQVYSAESAGQGSEQNPSVVDGSPSTWFYGPQMAASHSISVPNSQGARTQAQFYPPGPSPHQEEVYVRQYQQWEESFTSGSQQNPSTFPTQDPGLNAYNYGHYAGQSTQSAPIQSNEGTSQGPFGQQYSNVDGSYQVHNPGDGVYAEFYEMLGGQTGAVHPPAQRPLHRDQYARQSQATAQHSQAGAVPYPKQAGPSPQPPRPVVVPYPNPPGQTELSPQPPTQQYGQTPTAHPRQGYPSPARPVSNSPQSWPSDGAGQTPTSAGTTSLQFKIHNPAPQPPDKAAKSSGRKRLSVRQATNSRGPKDTISTSAPPSLGARPGKRKRTRKDPESDAGEDDSGSESEDDGGMQEGGISVGVAGLGVVSTAKGKKKLKPTGACKHCKKLKMKCDFPKGETSCKRCRSTGYACIVEGRKQRAIPNKREYLLAQIRQKDAVIESLLKQLHNPYIATPLSIASFRMATSPSDKNNQDVLQWLDQFQSSLRDADPKAAPNTFLIHREKKLGEESDEDQPAPGEVEENSDSEGLASEAQIRSSLPDTHVPLGLIADLSLSNSKSSRKHKKDDRRDPITVAEDDLNDENVGVANETYFMPGPATDLGMRASLIQQHSPPEILVHGLVTPEDVKKLFDIFFERINPFTSLLDRALHTPELTFARCPFLYTVVCAVASRFYTEKSQIYPVAMHFAKSSAASALIDGWKSVELCQAYILMATYAVPARRWEEDRSWLYTGLAIRIATDLNLHHVSTVKPTSEKQEREILNKRRVWMICYNLDRSTATQFGKPSTIKEDFIVRNATEWYKQSKYNHIFDVHLCGYTALLQIVAKFHDAIFSDPSSPTGLNKRVDFRSVTLEYDSHLIAFEAEWTRRFNADSKSDDPACQFRVSLMPFLVSYSRLVMFSFGFQQALLRGLQAGDNVFFKKCLDSAKSVIVTMVESLGPSGYMRYAPDGHFVFASFASAFLLKLLRPEFSSYLTKEGESEIFDLIGRLIQTLSDPQIAIDDKHTPKLYARFLVGLLSRHRRDGATVGRLHTQPPPPQQTSTSEASSGLSASRFSVGPRSGALSGRDGTQGESSYGTAGGPIYTPEATFAPGGGPIAFGPNDMDSFSVNAFTEEDTLATMQIINNPSWWNDGHVLMPGFIDMWFDSSPSPPASGPPSSGSPYSTGSAGYRPNTVRNFPTGHNIPGPTAGNFGIFHSAPMNEIPLY